MYLKVDTMLNSEGDDLQEQKTTLGFIPVCQDQVSEAIVVTGSLKLDSNKNIKKKKKNRKTSPGIVT